MRGAFTSLLGLACLTSPLLHAQGTAFMYQGKLNASGNPATGVFDLTFSVYDNASGGSPVGAPLTSAPTGVTNGLFTVALDFGAGVFNGNSRWLEIVVRPYGSASAYTTLTPRQPILPAPYAIFAESASAAGISGTIPAANLGGTYGNAMLFNNPGNTFAGSFNGNGSGVTNVDLTTANTAGAITWTTYYGAFVPASSPTVGGGPVAVTAADVNGDGKADLISANYSVNTLSVLTNNGGGGFALAFSPVVGDKPYSVTTADVNGDGKMDLMSGNSGDHTLSVLTNNGSGGFGRTDYVVGRYPFAVTAADVSGDGKPDLICANYGSNTLSVLTNNGSGGFAVASSPAVGDRPHSVTAADVNGDGKVDLISANSGGDTLSVLTNNGSGGFALASSPAVGDDPEALTSADVNGDGKMDLITANYVAQTLSVLTNNGSGGFVLASSPGVGHFPFAVTAADVNGDGKADLICVNEGDDTLSVLTNNGNGGFSLTSSPGVGHDPTSVTTADVNGDGKVDLISANFGGGGGNTLSVLFNTPTSNGTATFSGNGTGLTALNGSKLIGSVAINGTTIIDSAGNWVGSPTGLQGPKGDAGIQGIQGPLGPTGPQGPKGDKGDPGPAVNTSAVCGRASTSCSSVCNGATKVVVASYADSQGESCFVTSDTGDCSSSYYDGFPSQEGYCCVCRP